MVIPRTWRRCLDLICCFIVIALASGAPSRGDAVIDSRSVQQKGGLSAIVQRLGSVDATAHREFTIVLKAGTNGAEAAAVATYLRRFGLFVTITPDDRFIHASGSYAAAGAAAGVNFERVKSGTETFVRTTGPVQFPYAIARYIAGSSVNPGVKVHSFIVNRKGVIAGPQTGYSPADFANIYDINPVYRSGIDGQGATIDIAACFNVNVSDITYFQSHYQLPGASLHIVHVDGTTDQSGLIPPPDIEPTIDVERVIATAPRASVNLYLVPDCLVSQFVDIFAKIDADGGETALSDSYGLGEADYAAFDISDLMEAQHAALQCIASHDVALFAASGDNGSWGDPFLATDFLDVNYPASDPYVIAVGGTTVEQTSLGTRLFEYAWGGSGGGYSNDFTIPSWQAVTPGVASGQFKNVPDVAIDGDPDTGAAVAFDVSLPPPLFPAGGTSAASPTWAGLWALVDESRRLHGHGKLSSAPAALYHLRGTPAFYDITVGDNGYYPAHVGYDNVTGVGVPDAAKLVTALQ
ncbi:MAG: S53 family peptidase [Candidatus Eremiobacteraeota bacterium]|nr:S53 family peptidase [Candidatus Eremiobacteraeota bacterium]